MPKFSWMTLATGARQFVVQEAFEMTWCAAGSYVPSLTPRTMVMSSFLAGALMMTFLTEPRRCLAASSRFVKRPVDSMTISAPTASHGISAGSFSAKTRNSSRADADAVLGGGDLLFEVAEHGVVLQEVRQRLRVRDVVDGHEVDVLVAEAGAQDVAADAPEAVDSNFDCHSDGSLLTRDL